MTFFNVERPLSADFDFYDFLSGWAPPVCWLRLLWLSFRLSAPCLVTLTSMTFFNVERPLSADFDFYDFLSAWAPPVCWLWLPWLYFMLSKPCLVTLIFMTFFHVERPLSADFDFYDFISGWAPPVAWFYLLWQEQRWQDHSEGVCWCHHLQWGWLQEGVHNGRQGWLVCLLL